MTKKKTTRRTPSKAAKSKDVQTHSPKATPSEAAASQEPATSATVSSEDEFEGRIYTTSLWKHLPNYECLFCAYATVDHDAALDHFKSEHALPQKKARIINTGLVNEDGAPITRVEPAEED